MGSLAWEALQRLHAPVPFQGMTVMVVAGIGVLVNAATAALFMAGRDTDLNIRGAFLHMAADALVSLGVVLTGGLYLWRGWRWIDPLTSLVIAAVIVAGTWSLFRRSLHLLFDGLLRAATADLHEHFEFRHVTLQLESATFAGTCDVGAEASPTNTT